MTREFEEFETEKEKIAFLEGLAVGIWKLSLHLDLECGHCKRYDPLVIEIGIINGNTNYVAHSYVFDMNDGGRHHHYNSLEEIFNDLLKEIQKYKIKSHKEI